MEGKTAGSLSPRRLLALLAVVATALAAGMHFVFGYSAGALWRDEVNSLELATVHSLGELWRNLDYDSFPALFFLVLRMFAGVPAEISDTSLRIFGVGVGLLILGALWWNGRVFRFGAPLISVALLGFHPAVIRYGDSIRGYGLGILLTLVTFSALWKVVEAPSLGRSLLAALLAVLSVQCLYYNSILLFALCVAGMAVCVYRGRWRRASLLLGIGALAAISLLPYLPTIKRVQAWNFQFKRAIDFGILWDSLSKNLGPPFGIGVWIWLGLIVIALAAASTTLWRARNDAATDSPQHDRLLFATITLVVGTLGYAGFLRILSYTTQPWYFILFFAFVATCLEIIFASVSERAFALSARGIFAAAFIGLTISPALQAVALRQTNIDLIAARLHSSARPNDLILVNRWNYGVSFHHYFRGLTPWTTIPPMDDLRFHRCDLAKQQMMAPDPLADVRQQIAETLRRGNDVWVVGSIDIVRNGQKPLIVPPGYDGPQGWNGGDFYLAWSQQTSYFLQTNALGLEIVVAPEANEIVKFENLPLSRFYGFRENGESASAFAPTAENKDG